MSDPDISVVIAIGSAGRAVLPTLRSVLASEGVGALDVAVVCTEDRSAATARLLEEAGMEARVLSCADDGRAAQRNRGIALAAAPVIAVVDAGDLVAPDWLRRAAETAREDDAIARPEAVVTFGGRSGWWPQPGQQDGALLLPVAPAWGASVVATADTWSRMPYPLVTDDDLDAAWQAETLSRGARQSIVARTAAFQRVWTERAPWEFHVDALAPTEFLRNAEFAASVEPPAAPPQRTVLTVRGIPVGRAARAVAEPWLRGARRLAGARRPGFPEWVRRSWGAANRLEPLVPFLRPDTAGWFEHASDSGSERERAARGYWWLLARVGSPVDYLFFAPWLRTGGGDSVLRQYLEAALRRDPGARTALVTTEPEASPMLAALPAAVRVAEARELLAAGVHRDRLVRQIVPALLTQLAPHTVHAFNSTVAFDVIERIGHRLSSELFLTTFAIDRSADGERLSVLFLRPPRFLDPVRAVLVDSEQFVDTAVRELGYPRERFVVQRSVIDLPERTHRGAVDGPLRVFWAGRFDLPKRLDVLARVLRHARSAGFPLEVHYYGLEVMGTPGLSETLASLEKLGAIRHPPYRSFAELPLERLDAYLLTSEWEGVPLTVLEAMASGVPVVAPLVGGVGEVLTAATGYPVPAFDDEVGYLAAFRAIRDDYPEALRRAAAARELVQQRFSPEAFDAVLERLEGYLRRR